MSTPTQHISDQRAPTRARPDRASWTEYQRLLTAGVNPTAAAVLASGQPRADDERAYWRQLARSTPTTPTTRAAAQRQRRARTEAHRCPRRHIRPRQRISMPVGPAAGTSPGVWPERTRLPPDT